jgi:hypothetical protein
METTMQKIREMVDVNTIIGDPISTPDGVTLTPHTLPSGTWRAVSAHDGKIIVLGGKCIETDDLFATTTEHDVPVGGWDTVAYGDGFFLALAGGTTCMSSPADTIDWLPKTFPNYAMLGLAFGAEWFVTVGDGILAAGVIDAAEAFSSATAPNSQNPFVTEADLEPIETALKWEEIA